MTEPRVTVAIPSFNSAATIGPCLSSLCLQSFPVDDYEIVLGDNGSTDGTAAFVHAQFPNVRVVHAAERGSGFARNAAIAAARGEYILSIDADCTADPNWIAAMTAALDAQPEVDAFGGAIRPFSQSTVVERFRHTWIRQENLSEGKGPIRYAETPNAAYRRNVFTQLGGFDGSVMDDSDLGVRMTKAGMRIDYLPEAIVFHRNPSTLRRLYRQRYFYGSNEPALGEKYPELWPPIRTLAQVRERRYRTVRRIARDFARLPAALIGADRSGGTRFAPLIDMVVAVAYQRGLEHGVRARMETSR